MALEVSLKLLLNGEPLKSGADYVYSASRDLSYRQKERGLMLSRSVTWDIY